MKWNGMEKKLTFMIMPGRFGRSVDRSVDRDNQQER